MNTITELWNKLKSMLHHGPSLQPLWQAVVDKLSEHDASIEAIKAGPKAEIEELLDELLEDAGKAMEEHFAQMKSHFEARIAALEQHPAMSIPSLVQSGGQLPTEQIIQPAAESANDSSTAGDNAGPASPTAQPDPDGAGQNDEEHHDLKGSGEHHGE